MIGDGILMTTTYTITSYEEAKQLLLAVLDNEGPIYLLGRGENGKTHLTRAVEEDITHAKRTVFRDVPDKIKKLNKTGIYEINQASQIVPNEHATVIDFNKVRYTGPF